MERSLGALRFVIKYLTVLKGLNYGSVLLIRSTPFDQ